MIFLSRSTTEILYCFRNEASTSILVCSKGGGGLLEERMELVAELWENNIKVGEKGVLFVCLLESSCTTMFMY